MAVNAEVLRLLGTISLSLDQHVDQATRLLVASWARAWDEIVQEWQEALAQIMASIEDGKWPTQGQLARLDRVQRARDTTREALVALGRQAGVTISQQIPKVPAEGADWERLLVQAQLPPVASAGITSAVSLTFNRIDKAATDAIVRRSTQQITALSRPIAAEAEEHMKRVLIRGVLIGDHPEVAAREMLRRTQGAFDGGLNRARVIARTEILDAHRAGGLAADKANPKLVTGWTWSAVLDTRTCFPAGTLITTAHGQVPIEHVVTGDKVLTHTGRWRQVYDPMSRRFAGEMVTVTTGSMSVTATADHPFLVERVGALAWVQAREIERGDVVLSDRIADQSDHGRVELPVERRGHQPQNRESLAAHDAVLAGVPLADLIMPVGLVNLDDQRTEQEVDRTLPSGDRSLLLEGQPELFQRTADVALRDRLASVSAIAAPRAEAATTGRDDTEVLAAGQAIHFDGWTAASLRAVTEPSPMRVENAPASSAWSELCIGAARRASLVTVGIAARQGHLDSAVADHDRAPSSPVALAGAVGSRTRATGDERGRADHAYGGDPGHGDLAGRSVGMLALMGGVALASAESAGALADPGRWDLELGPAPATSPLHRHIVSKVETHIQALTVYNFEVEGDHSYIANGFAVHNCPSCWSQHGSEHPADEPGPNDHPQGRCARIPTTPSWASLGFEDIPEPPSLLADARQTFDNLPGEQRLAIMGAERLALLDSGQVAWGDLSTTRSATGWRDSQVVTPVKVLARL